MDAELKKQHLSGQAKVVKAHESKFHETLFSVSGYFRMKYVSPVCAEGTSVKRNFKNSLRTGVPKRRDRNRNRRKKQWQFLRVRVLQL